MGDILGKTISHYKILQHIGDGGLVRRSHLYLRKIE